ncbi:hypothetical protein SDC9_142987 [bioreactor metagenome]|uniref:Uncharacterized protein n=1 Tax=bioreactor metagenome TaxID=1076179 RepID=A0A645E5I6_9ZZZZ
MADVLQLVFGNLPISKHSFNAVAIFSFQLMDQLQAVLHLFQSARIEFDLIQIATQFSADITELVGNTPCLFGQSLAAAIYARQ